MIWAYVLENMGVEDLRSNQSVFLLIKDLKIEDKYLYFDNTFERPELEKLLDCMGIGDKLIIRSVEDIADSLSELANIFQRFSEKKIVLCSCVEPFLCEEDYQENLNGYVKLYLYYNQKKKDTAYQKALSEGKVGRPLKTVEIEKAINMYESGQFKISQIEMITGVSKSTIYRYANKKQ
ncbi:hypothetical protein CS063_04800 [Sporanaerobium hydrogeniformans]|uniref:Uncharacterized protein n=1 Tax=Sporanaerobium hydrogeniformans TaxID=3072179 RepID=A0AC61DG16_9FIRM|nr:helix-turn-helix domain-containing protein [Sporanaerobium hydrogeniformans]PHV71877.1 hypothetical protein CS063_04800 [Sporanaerobium hydrogeniformans]